MQIVRSLNPEDIGSMPVGDVVYENEWLTRHALGKTVLANGQPIHLAVELPVGLRPSQTLFTTHLRQIGHMLAEAPELLPYVPSFVGALASDSQWGCFARAVLTEDVTEGGRYLLDPQPPSAEFQQKSVQLGLKPAEADALMVSEIAGQEKIISFSPPPFTLAVDTGAKLKKEVFNAQEALTVMIGPDSALSESIASLSKIAG